MADYYVNKNTGKVVRSITNAKYGKKSVQVYEDPETYIPYAEDSAIFFENHRLIIAPYRYKILKRL